MNNLKTAEGFAVTWDDIRDGSRIIFKTEAEAKDFASNCASNIAGLASNVKAKVALPSIQVVDLRGEE